jgi:C_GCAxxG_C_C family probable redox protein
MTKTELALKLFLGDYNCAQAVFFTFSDELDIDRDLALRLATGFGSGMGRKAETCGAISGGILVLSARFGQGLNDDPEKKLDTYWRVRELLEHFRTCHGTYLCRELLDGCDMNTEAGQQEYHERQLDLKVCRPCIETLITFLEQQI